MGLHHIALIFIGINFFCGSLRAFLDHTWTFREFGRGLIKCLTWGIIVWMGYLLEQAKGNDHFGPYFHTVSDAMSGLVIWVEMRSSFENLMGVFFLLGKPLPGSKFLVDLIEGKGISDDRADGKDETHDSAGR